MHFDGLLTQHPAKSSEALLSEPSVQYKRLNWLKLRKAIVPKSCQSKFVSKASLHRRVDEPFDGLYEPSPQRKIQKLREARRPGLVFRVRPKATAKSLAYRESFPELIKDACTQWLSSREQRLLNLRTADLYFRTAKDQVLGGVRSSRDSGLTQCRTLSPQSGLRQQLRN